MIQFLIILLSKILMRLKKNTYFTMFNSIEEIFNELDRLIDKSQPSLREENNKIFLFIPLLKTKIKLIEFEMNEEEEEKSDKGDFEELYSINANLKKELELTNKKKEELTAKVEEQNLVIEELTETLEKLEREKDMF